MSKKIFLSYAMEDRHHLEGLKEILEKHRITTEGEHVGFIDPMSEPSIPGTNIRAMIKKQIKSSNEVVVIATDDSLSSQWVNYEIGMADALNKPIVIVGRKGSGKTSLLQSLDGVRLVEMDEKANE